jgi:hypothetical protein
MTDAHSRFPIIYACYQECGRRSLNAPTVLA